MTRPLRTLTSLLVLLLLTALVAVPARATQFGTSNPDGLGFRIDVQRVYLQAPDNWNGIAQPSVVSFKLPPAKVNAGRYDRMLRHWFATAPHVPIWYTFWHEPENDMTTPALQSQYRKAWAHIVRIERASRNDRYLKATTLFMSYTLKPGSGRHVKDYYPGNRWVDVLGFDGYNRPYAGRYMKPGGVYGKAYKVAVNHGKPFALGEWGSVVFNGDYAGRADWIRATGRWLSHRHVVFATWWNANGAKGDFRLNDAASKRALRRLMR